MDSSTRAAIASHDDPLMDAKVVVGLIGAGYAAGIHARAYRKDLIGALILAAPETAAELDKLVRSYRRASARDARVGKSATSVLDPSRPRPGRRPRAPERAGR